MFILPVPTITPKNITAITKYSAIKIAISSSEALAQFALLGLVSSPKAHKKNMIKLTIGIADKTKVISQSFVLKTLDVFVSLSILSLY
jgi:hypothetical protein